MLLTGCDGTWNGGARYELYSPGRVGGKIVRAVRRMFVCVYMGVFVCGACF